MATQAARTTQRGARDHGFHPVPIRRVVPETAESASFVLDIPPDLRDAFAYEAGQFLTFRVEVAGEAHLRCYSMSSSPVVDDELTVTVKRVPGGAVSNRMIDDLGPGAVVEVTRPAGVFCLGPGDGDIVAFGAGSGITPIFSLVKTALATTERRVRLLYANRDRDAVIFDAALDALVAKYPGRLDVVHHLDVEHGYVDTDALRPFIPSTDGASDSSGGAEFYVCGPGPFMDIVETTLLDGGVDTDRIRIERFSPATEIPPGTVSPPGATEPNGDDAGATETVVTIELDGTVDAVAHHPGTTILQTARQMGMAPPYSCESGSCATCMARLVEGTATMYVNNALDDDEVEEGWVLTCQAVPTSSVRVVYGDEE